MDSDLPSLTKFEENGSVEFIAVLVSVLDEVFTKYRGIQDWGNGVLRKRAKGWFSNLRIKTGATFYVDVFILIFRSYFEVLDQGISTNSSSLFCLIKLKVSNSCPDTK